MLYAEQSEVSDYYKLDHSPLSGKQYKILLHVKFGESTVINVHELVKLDMGIIKSVKLYYSDFPKKQILLSFE